ncbi:hypothetical protein [Natrinema longum]|uniref:Uncharacterized protein n=1 Tax=Natrinema longum TaxID=370324 RepID=A0A8A2UA55_9EURY|nr:hypothetical protein [Natrinema longum]MBZ6496445.1 hypothetical protein [Natrinema longum]QSW85649.1 hypothetical protein J0X27_02045 [Natrinema longum]
MDYYDRLLAGMLTSLVVGAAVGFHPAVDFRLGLLGGALLATAFLWEAIVRHPPVPTAEPGYAVAAIVWHGLVLAVLLTV